MSDFNSIPVPTNNVDVLVMCVAALKQNVEMLCGQRGGDVNAAAHVYVQVETPKAVATGDLWIVPFTNTIDTPTMHYWDGKAWQFFSESYSGFMARAGAGNK